MSREASTRNASEANPDGDADGWYVLRTMPRHEKKLAIFLEQRGIEVYLPVQNRKRRWSDRTRIVEMPLFPGYLFLRFDYAARRSEVLARQAAIDFVRVQGQAARMRAEELQNLQLLINQATELQTDASRAFAPGESVEITFGPFKGVRGVVKKAKNRTRLYVDVPLLGRTVWTEIDAMDLERVFE